MAKSRNNLLGVGGQRRKLSRSGQQSGGPASVADRRAAADQKADLVARMRQRSADTDATPDSAPETSEASTPSDPSESETQSDRSA
ncbi:DUF6243 family protein [Streptomyces sp. NPDC006798]|uniref:DUF6243 family protein n=1 Tax=Streptomyces sp. NPDC006798 TaxID=3155462 RepID=UPI0033D8B24F